MLFPYIDAQVHRNSVFRLADTFELAVRPAVRQDWSFASRAANSHPLQTLNRTKAEKVNSRMWLECPELNS